MNSIKIQLLVLLSFILVGAACSKSNLEENESKDKAEKIDDKKEKEPEPHDLSIKISCEGNSWVDGNPSATLNMIAGGGIKNWASSNDKIRTYFYAKNTGAVEVGIRAKFPAVSSTIKATFGNITQEVTYTQSTNYNDYFIGSFPIDQIGYHFIELQGISKEGNTYGEVTDILLGKSTWASDIQFIPEDNIYWGRRGPAPSLAYKGDFTTKNITWYYNEVTVPEGNDPLNSFFMAIGFSGGYFGLQVNSPTRRTVLFSVWSAYATDNPDQIPEEYTVEPLGNGSGVVVGEFGGEGSGGQSHLEFPWVAGKTYKFLLKGESVEPSKTDYAAYFFAPETGEWKLIASFRKPHAPSNYLTGFHSFSENFDPLMGDIERKVVFNNQWAYDSGGNWNEVTTGVLQDGNSRLDSDGNAVDVGDGFYLRSCGFFSNFGPRYVPFTRLAKGTPPDIDFSQLEAPSIERDYAVEMKKDGYLEPSAMAPYGDTYTISGMVKPTGGGTRTIGGWGNTGGSGTFFRIEGDNHLYLGQYNIAEFKKVKSEGALINNVWSHVAVVVENNVVSFYINGAYSSSGYVNGAAPMDNSFVPDNFKFGALEQASVNYGESFDGLLDDLAFWTKARTANEIKDEAANGLTGSETGLWGYWDFEDNVETGASTADLSGSGHPLRIGGAAKIQLFAK